MRAEYTPLQSKVNKVDKNKFNVYCVATMSLIDKISINRKAKHRLRQILKMRKQGVSMEAIGLEFGISKQRVSHILKKEKGKLIAMKENK